MLTTWPTYTVGKKKKRERERNPIKQTNMINISSNMNIISLFPFCSYQNLILCNSCIQYPILLCFTALLISLQYKPVNLANNGTYSRPKGTNTFHSTCMIVGVAYSILLYCTVSLKILRKNNKGIANNSQIWRNLLTITIKY